MCPGLPWWLSGKESPANAGDMGLISDPGRSHVLWSNQAHVPQLLSLCSRAWELRLLSPLITSTEAYVPQSLCSTRRHLSEKPARGNYRVAPTVHN